MDHLNLVKETFGEVADSQEDKGIIKYGKPLDPLDDYDWLDMALEESVDGTKYLVAEKVKRIYHCKKLRSLVLKNCEGYVQQEMLHWVDKLEGRHAKRV